MARTSRIRSALERVDSNLRLAWWNALTGIRTTSGPNGRSAGAAACCAAGTVALDTLDSVRVVAEVAVGPS